MHVRQINVVANIIQLSASSGINKKLVLKTFFSINSERHKKNFFIMDFLQIRIAALNESDSGEDEHEEQEGVTATREAKVSFHDKQNTFGLLYNARGKRE